jgi:hypothetical protein
MLEESPSETPVTFLADIAQSLKEWPTTDYPRNQLLYIRALSETKKTLGYSSSQRVLYRSPGKNGKPGQNRGCAQSKKC